MLALLALTGDARRFQLQVDVDLLALGLLAHLELGFVERPAAGDFAPLRILFAADAFLGDRELLRQPRRFDRLRARQSCASSASCSRSARSRVSSARWTARRNSTSRSCSSRAYSVSRSISKTFFCASRFWLRISTSVRCSISLRILRRVSINSVSWVRPSASKAFDGSKYSRLVWSRSTMATFSSSRPLAASASEARSRTWLA